ncbi:MAG: MaoC family dehydratase N-terminal domain-containing protein [Actinomycetales bacterium]|nr:MaoC family dehydratase N-terminal domain-containing protein [Actinomycetales bacterium]
MAVNPGIEGKRYPPAPPYAVGREKVREFARAVFATSPIHHDVEAARAAGYADLVAPPTFPIVVGAALETLIEDPEAGIDFGRVVHGDQRFVLARPIVAGDELTARLTVTAVRVVGGNAMVTAESALTDADGEHVATSISSLVVRGDS